MKTTHLVSLVAEIPLESWVALILAALPLAVLAYALGCYLTRRRLALIHEAEIDAAGARGFIQGEQSAISLLERGDEISRLLHAADRVETQARSAQ